MGINNFIGTTSTPNNNNPAMPTPPTSPLKSPSSAAPDDAMSYLINYNEKFKTAGYALFRDSIVNQTMAVLIGKNKPNALLVGPAGVGKTKIAEDIAFRIATNDPSVPDKLLNHTVYELPLSSVVAGSGIVGDLEAKVKTVIDFCEDPSNKAILFIDEIHQLVGDSTIYEKIAQILKPALARGEIKVIGATTSQEASNLVNDPAFNRRFSRVIVDELTNEQTVAILEKSLAGFTKHYDNRVMIEPSILPTVVALANQYGAAGNHRPDTAITLLDRTCADAIIARKIQESKAALDPDPTILQAIQAVPFITITDGQLRRTAITIMTGHAEQKTFDKDELIDKLSVIKGQDKVVSHLVELLSHDARSLYPRTKPLTVLFAGASGVGKTEVAKIIANELTGLKPIILNMPEFHSGASINRIIGSPAGYVGSDSHAELPFDILESNPYQVILLDEFEKADRAVQTLFMSAFDEGYIKMANNKIIDFTKSIIIATTNANHTTGKIGHAGFCAPPTEAELNRRTMQDLAQWFPPELLNRFNTVLTFNGIDKATYRDILAKTYEKDIARIKQSFRKITLPDKLDDATLDRLTEDTFVSEFGARPAKRTIQAYIEENAD